MTGPRAPLSVRINDGKVDRHVTKAVHDLTFRKTAPGGFSAASMRIQLPRSAFTDLGPNDKVYIYDARTGATIWEGFTENPGTMDGPAGQGFDLSAMGTTILATDETRPLAYIDQSLDKWARGAGTTSATVAVDNGPPPEGVVGGDGIKIQFPPGQAVKTNETGQVTYYSLLTAGMEAAAVFTRLVSGKDDAGYRDYLRTNNAANTDDLLSQLVNNTISTTSVTRGRWFDGVSGNPAPGVAVMGLALRRSAGATNIADDSTWTFFDAITVLARRMNRYGTPLTGAADHGSATSVLASQVAEDVLGRLLRFCDKGGSTIEATSFAIDQLTYHDGVRAADLLDSLALWEPGFLWEMLHSTPSGYVFNYRAWPTTARYELSVSDGYNAPGADIDLCNRIAVFWTDARGAQQTTIVTASVAALGGAPGDAGARTRDADPITLPSGQGSAANAQQIGQQVLAAKSNPPKAATAVVKRRILDRLTGNTVMPWEIEPGYLVRVRETGDLLRLTEVEYVDNDCAATLTLGEPQLSIEQRIARLSKMVA